MAEVLTPSQIKSIQNDIIEAFGEEWVTNMQVDFIRLKALIQRFLQRIKLEETFHSNSTHKGYTVVNLGKRKQKLLAEGYLLIMLLRQYLIGESINYRYYYTTSTGTTTTYQFEDKDLLKYLSFNKASLFINPKLLKLNNQIAAQEYNDLVNLWFDILTNGDKNQYLQKTTDNYGYVVRSAIMSQYYTSNPGLKNKKTGRYQVFNKGHIREAIDNAISYILSLKETQETHLLPPNQKVPAAVFGKYLYYDSIKASQGADNPITNTSIKSNGSDLYDYYTIYTQLKKIDEALQMPTKDNLINMITEIYLHKSNFQDSEVLMQQEAELIADKLINELTL